MPRYVREERIAERPSQGPNHVRVDNEMRGCLKEFFDQKLLTDVATVYWSRIETKPSSKA